MDKADSRLERWETAKQFAILPHEFSVGHGGITASLKIRRETAGQRHTAAIESFFIEDEIVSG
ncbi:MAG: hypothetical protein LBI84_03315 [Propionibacteriaceae bacterium]|nr:hypothetical protein [Propionibacteriaceae bacterium]